MTHPRPDAGRRAGSPPRRLVALWLLAAGALATPVQALVRPAPDPLGERVVPAPIWRAIPVEPGASGPGAAEAAAFRARHPGPWRITFDRRTGRLDLASGRGIPLLPGRGNSLTPAAAGLPPGGHDLAQVEPLARRVLDAEGLRPGRGELRLNPSRSGGFDGGRVWFVDFDWIVEGVPVEGARAFLRVNHGNVVQIGSSRIGPGLPPSAPILEAGDALERAFEHAGGRRPEDAVVEPGSLRFVARPAAAPVAWGRGVDYRLVWRVAFRRGDRPATWTADVDARTGELLSFEDATRYARVTAGVFPRTVTDAEEQRPLPFARVVQGGATVDADAAGRYGWGGGRAFTSLDGAYFRAACEACRDPEQAFAFTDRGTGDLRLGGGGADEVGNGASTRAARNSFFHLNRVRLLAAKWLSLPWLNTTVTANVNIDDACNAFWNGISVNFFRSGSGCSNTGEIGDVVYHEWGHGLDGNTLPGDGSTGEATGDIVSMHVTHDSLLGPSFLAGGGAVRDLESSSVGYVAKESNLPSFCFVCTGQCSNGPRGHEIHCEGEIYGQAHWDLAKALRTKHGENTGWQAVERLFFVALPQTGSQYADLGGPAYDAYLAVDDDNGNLADGTPNCDEIFAAFSTHEIAGAYCGGSTPGCARPAEPDATATPLAGSVRLDWPAVPGAASYRVMRSDFSPTGPYLPLGTTAGTQLVDGTAHAGLTYHYVVEAMDATGCRSTIEGAVAASPLPGAGFDLAGVAADDVPAGNRSGFPDPGESVDLTLSITNHSPADPAAAAQGTLASATGGVTPTLDQVSYGAVPPGGTAAGSAYRVAIDGGVACGTDARLDLAIDDGGGGGPAQTAALSLLVGEPRVRFSDDFETDQGWSLGSGTATAGLWDLGDPGRTAWQPEFAAGGSGCLFTGTNTGTSTGDVDGGETIVLSPVLDLSGAAAARLSYRRWWAASTTTDPADRFAVDVSDDAGASWVTVETAGAAERAPGWMPVTVPLEAFVDLTDGFQVRFRAADGGADTTVEAAVDDVSVAEVVCDLTPPCFVPPAFAGAAAAAPGPSCGEIDVSWTAAASNCLNAAITYNVYRSPSPSFAPGPATLVASGVTGTSFHDTLLQPGATYHYVVRAFDSRSGEDANTVVVSASPPAGPDVVPPQFGGLTSATSGAGCGDVALAWPAAVEGCSGPPRYDVFRSTSPGFTPDASNRVASTLSAGFLDTALSPGQTYYYVVRAVDQAGNEDPNQTTRSASAGILPLVAYDQEFEASAGGWSTIAPNTATTGRWEWGDPEGTGPQPEDDATPPPGVNAWITGLAALGGLGGNDIDAGVTTLVSPVLDLTATSAPVLTMALSFSNDAGANPGEDPFQVHVSDDDGASWEPVLVTLASIPGWSLRQFPLAGIVTPNDRFRIRVRAEDQGLGGSLVEAGVDDVRVIEPGAGCGGCPAPVPGVAILTVDRDGDDVILDWGADPVAATSYNVYLLSGPGFSQAVRAGSTAQKGFVHTGAALIGESFFYRVTAVDACGGESDLP